MAITEIIGAVSSVLDRIIPDEEQRDRAKLELLKQKDSIEIKKIEMQTKTITAEGSSKDAYTSRARPSFLYVFYAFILSAIPMGILNAFNPQAASEITAGMTGYLAAIPQEMWWVFATGYLGYTGARTVDKGRLSNK